MAFLPATVVSPSMVPVNVEGTINHLARTLPDSSNMMIEVQTPAGLPKLVDLPKVLRALHWLKAKNDLYKDIEINENFKFTNGKDVVFMKDHSIAHRLRPFQTLSTPWILRKVVPKLVTCVKK